MCERDSGRKTRDKLRRGGVTDIRECICDGKGPWKYIIVREACVPLERVQTQIIAQGARLNAIERGVLRRHDTTDHAQSC